LCAKSNRQAEYARSRQQRRNLNTERPQRRKREDRDKNDGQCRSKQRQQRQKSRVFGGWAVRMERRQLPQSAIDGEASGNPAEIDDKGKCHGIRDAQRKLS
jgi:hypothetical protein